jgi:hypothetical protein
MIIAAGIIKTNATTIWIRSHTPKYFNAFSITIFFNCLFLSFRRKGMPLNYILKGENEFFLMIPGKSRMSHLA